MAKPTFAARPTALARLRMSLAAAALLPVLGAGCAIDVGDQSCTPESNVTDKEDRCPYGAPGGPKPKIEGCQLPAQISGPQCTATWTQVHAIFEAPQKGNCSADACHGKVALGDILIPPGDPVAALAAIRGYSQAVRGPYLDVTNPRSWILCNLRGDKSGGSPMPKPSGLPDQNDIDIVTNWVACGAKDP